MKTESLDEFLKRGGKIQKPPHKYPKFTHRYIPQFVDWYDHKLKKQIEKDRLKQKEKK